MQVACTSPLPQCVDQMVQQEEQKGKNLTCGATAVLVWLLLWKAGHVFNSRCYCLQYKCFVMDVMCEMQ